MNKISSILFLMLVGAMTVYPQFFDYSIDTMDVSLIQSHTTTYEIEDNSTVWMFDSVQGIEYPRYTTLWEPYDPKYQSTFMGNLRIVEPLTQNTLLEMECSGFGHFSETGKYFSVYDTLAAIGSLRKPGQNPSVIRIYNLQSQLIAQRMPNLSDDPEFSSVTIGPILENIPGYIDYGEFKAWIGMRGFDNELIWKLDVKDFMGTEAEPLRVFSAVYYEWEIIQSPVGDQLLLWVKEKGIYGINLLTGGIKWSVPGSFPFSQLKVEESGRYFYCANKGGDPRYLYRADGKLVTQITRHYLNRGFRVWGDTLLVDSHRIFKIPEFEILNFTDSQIERGGNSVSLSQNGKFLIREGWGGEGVFKHLLSVTMKSGKELPYIPVNFLDAASPRKLQISNDGNHLYFTVPSGDVTPKFARFVHINLEGVPGWDVY